MFTKSEFSNDPNLTVYDEGVMIYRNFIDAETVKNITSIVDDVMKVKHKEESRIPWYNDRTTPMIDELFPIWEKISAFLAPTHVIHPKLEITIMKPGDSMFVHEDSPGEGNEHMLTNYDVWNTCTTLDYGVIAYFGDWEGGEVYYPELDGLTIDPKPGDLVIHGATPQWKHGVKEVTSGIRYAYSNFCLPASKNPKSFYNYGTQEYQDQLKDGLKVWHDPLYKNEREYADPGPNVPR